MNQIAAAKSAQLLHVSRLGEGYGRVSEVERFSTKMLRVDVPNVASAPLLGEGETFETFFYGGAAIFSLTPMTEEAARKWADHERPKPLSLMDRRPQPYDGDYDPDDSDF